MKKEPDSQIVEVEQTTDIEVLINSFEDSLIQFLERNNLPTENILAPIAQRQVVLGNFNGVITQIESDQQGQSIYLAKFAAAAANGLFDAALNYLWDETILELRNRVTQYDLSYFFDNAGLSIEKRRKVNTASDLVELTDSELIHGAKEIGLISQIGFRHLDYVKYMRNWASAAHPNQNEITGLQLISWLETCIKEVISLPLSNATVEIKKLLPSIRSQIISESEAKEISTFFLELTQEQVDNLTSGLFGIYTRIDSLPSARDNVRLLAPYLWGRVSEETRRSFGVKYARFTNSGDQQEKQYAREFLAHVEALEYIPDGLRAAEIESAVETLLKVHRNSDNFYTEPTFAKQLARLIGSHREIPKQIEQKYVHGLVEVFLTNGHGTVWNAEPTYRDLLAGLNSNQALIAVLSFRDDTISSQLQFNLSREKFMELLELMKPKAATPAMSEMIELIENSSAPLDNLRNETRVKERIENLLKIIGG